MGWVRYSCLHPLNFLQRKRQSSRGRVGSSTSMAHMDQLDIAYIIDMLYHLFLAPEPAHSMNFKPGILVVHQRGFCEPNKQHNNDHLLINVFNYKIRGVLWIIQSKISKSSAIIFGSFSLLCDILFKLS